MPFLLSRHADELKRAIAFAAVATSSRLVPYKKPASQINLMDRIPPTAKKNAFGFSVLQKSL